MSTSDDSLVDLPKGWVCAKLGTVVDVVRGASPRPKGDIRYFGGKIPWIKISDVTKVQGKFISETREGVTEEGAKKSRFLKAGTLILSNSGTVCVPKILAVSGCIHDGFVAFPEIPNDIDILYLYYYFDSIRPKIIQENRQGITQVNLNTNIVSDIQIPLPPLSEQHRIVSKIEELFTKLDAGVDELKKAKAKLRRYRQAVLQAALTGELTRQWRARNIDKIELADVLISKILYAHRNKWEQRELARMLERGKQPNDNKWKENYGPPKEPDIHALPELPIGWTWATAEQLASAENHSMTDGPFGSNLKTEHYTIEGPRVIRLQNIGSCEFTDEKAHISKDRFLRLKKHAVHSGDIVIRSLGLPSPTACMIPDWVGDAIVKADCFRYKVAEPFINSKYVMYALNSPNTQKRTEVLIHGVGRPRLNLSEVKSIPLPLPPLQEQVAIVDEVESRFSIMDEVSSLIDTNLKRIETLRQAVFKTAFEGKLVPQNPSNEPAENILEKISQSANKNIQKQRETKSNGDTPNGK